MAKSDSKTVTKKAVHRIKFSPDRIIEPGTTFACPVGNVAELEAAGAITDPKTVIPAEVRGEAPASVPAPAAPEVAAPAPAAPTEPVADVTPKVALKAAQKRAEALGIVVRKNWKLTTIQSKIRDAEAGR